MAKFTKKSHPVRNLRVHLTAGGGPTTVRPACPITGGYDDLVVCTVPTTDGMMLTHAHPTAVALGNIFARYGVREEIHVS